MKDLTDRLKAIQAAAGGDPSEQAALDLDIAGAPEASSEPVEPPPALPQRRAVPVLWARAEILAALERGAVSQALPLPYRLLQTSPATVHLQPKRFPLLSLRTLARSGNGHSRPIRDTRRR